MALSITAHCGKDFAARHVYATVIAKAFSKHIENLTPFEVYRERLARGATTLGCSRRGDFNSGIVFRCNNVKPGMALIHIGNFFAIDGIIIVAIGFFGHDHHGAG